MKSQSSVFRVDGKVALVTGGAKGLGEAMSQVLAQNGAQVVLTDLDEAEGRRVAASITAEGGEAIFLRQDVTQEAQWEDIVAQITGKFGQLDVVVNNAGVGIAGTAENTSLDVWRKTIAVNLDAVFLGTRYGIAAMKGRGGSIINIASIEAMIADPNLAAYNASKGGVRSFTKSAALHCAKSGYKIRVNSVHPGYIWTPMVEDYLRKSGIPVEVGRAELDKLHPMGHVGEPLDIAYGVLYLASEASKWVTGSELVIDGGYIAQ